MTPATRSQASSPVGGHVPPHDLDAEAHVLGAMMLTASAVAAVAPLLDAEDFYRREHGTMFRVAVEMHGRGEPVEPVTFAAELERLGLLDGAGGRAKVHELAAIVPAAANVGHYARIVRDLARRRQALRQAKAIEKLALEGGDLAAIAEGFRDGAAAATPAARELDRPRVVPGGTFVLDSPVELDALWGSGDRILWAEGEPLMIVGPDGVGKSALAQQLVLRRAGIVSGALLDLPVAAATLRVLYVAADRPQQVRRSFARMVGPQHRAALDERLIVVDGLLDFDLAREPERLAAFAVTLGAGTIVLDSIKDVALDLVTDESGSRVSRALQAVMDAGIEIVVLHHQRKGDGKPKTIEDVYGSRWLVAKCGSILLVWGDPGDEVVSVRHLKQPAAVVGPLRVVHDHATGQSTVAAAGPVENDDDGSSLTERLLEWVAANPGQAKRQAVEAVEGSSKAVLDAIDAALASGLLRVERGQRNAQHLYPAQDRFSTPEKRSETVVEAPFPASVSRDPLKGDSETLSAECFPTPETVEADQAGHITEREQAAARERTLAQADLLPPGEREFMREIVETFDAVLVDDHRPATDETADALDAR